MPREDRERPRDRVRKAVPSGPPINLSGLQGMMNDYKPSIPGSESPVDDYRARKEAEAEALGVGGRKARRQAWKDNWERIAASLLRGVPLENLVERYGEVGGPREGRNSVAWDRWKDWRTNPRTDINTFYDYGQFKKGIANKDYIYDPSSGMYFNPGGNPSMPEWYNPYGERIGAPYPGPGRGVPQSSPQVPPINPNEIISGGLTYTPPPKSLPPGPVGPPVPTPSYLTGSTSQIPQTAQTSQKVNPLPWHGYTSPYSQSYNPLSNNVRGPQYRRQRQWRF